MVAARVWGQLAYVLDVMRRPVDASGASLPHELLSGLADLLGADNVSYREYDVVNRRSVFGQEASPSPVVPDGHALFWLHFWDCKSCSYSDRTGDRVSVTMESDFYSARELHATGMYADCMTKCGVEHEVMVCLPNVGGRSRRIVAFRGPGRGFGEQDRLMLSLLRPHLVETWHRLQRSRQGVAGNLTLRQRQLLDLVAAGASNQQIARRLVLSPHTVRKHLENIYQRLDVTNRTAAVAAARDAGLEPTPRPVIPAQRGERVHIHRDESLARTRPAHPAEVGREAKGPVKAPARTCAR